MAGADSALTAATQAIRLLCVSLPHLSGLAHTVRICADDRVRTAGIFPSGRLVLNPSWFLELNPVERAFVLAHELLHLALHTHHRTGDADHTRFNIAHDLIINDILEHELGIETPGGGVRRPGARHLSAERLMLDPDLPRPASPDTALAIALRQSVAVRSGSVGEMPDDVLTEALEIEWFPNETAAQRTSLTDATTRMAIQALALQVIHDRARKGAQATVVLSSARRNVSGTSVSTYVEALITGYQPPWQLALHRWLDAVTPHQRTYARASRRGVDRADVVLPGRDRAAQTLTLVLDCSGSMSEQLSCILGAIMSFGRGAGIEAVRVIQCDTAISRDDIVPLDDLATYRIEGFGGSDMSPAMELIADDPEVTAAVVITDGAIWYPSTPMPYEVLWAVYGTAYFKPPYGHVIRTTSDHAGVG